MNELVINCGGDSEPVVRELSAEEVDRRRAEQAAHAAIVETEQAAGAAEATITTRLEQRLSDLQAIIDRPQTTLPDNTVGSIRQAIRDLQSEVKTLARVDRLQTRKLIRLLEGTD